MTGPKWDSAQGRDPSSDTITDAMVCLQTGAYPIMTSPGEHKQLKDSDANIYNQQRD